jgi:tetratricopeptide (TPR) repeat protein
LKNTETHLGFVRDRAIQPAIKRFRASLIHYKKVNDPQFIQISGLDLAEFLLEVDEYKEGIKVLRDVIDASKKSATGRTIVAQSLLAIFLARSGDIKGARQTFNEAKKLYDQGKQKRVSDSWYLSWAEANLLVVEEKWEQAWKAYQHYLDEVVRLGARSFQFIGLRDWAKAYLLRGEEADKQRAKELFGEAIKVCEEIGANGWVTYLKEEMGKIQ